MLCAQGILNRHSRAERQSRTKLTVKPITEYNFYWQNITCTGRIWLILAEHDLYWLIVTLTGRIWLIGPYWHNTGRTWVILAEHVIYTGRIRLILAEHDLYWLTVTLTGRIWLIGPIGSQSKVFCRSALLCRFNIPVRILLIIMHTIEYAMSYDRKQDGCVDKKQYNFFN